MEFARLCANPDKADDPIDRAVIHAFEEDKGDSAQSVLDARGGVHHRVGFDNTAKRMTVTMESGLLGGVAAPSLPYPRSLPPTPP